MGHSWDTFRPVCLTKTRSGLQRELPEKLPGGLAERLWQRGRLLVLLDGLASGRNEL